MLWECKIMREREVSINLRCGYHKFFGIWTHESLSPGRCLMRHVLTGHRDTPIQQPPHPLIFESFQFHSGWFE